MEKLYHYTSVGGFEGIIKNNSIRMTRSAFLNDPYDCHLFVKLVEKYLDSNEELVKEIRDLNYKSHLYGVSHHVEPKQEAHTCQCQHHEHECQCHKHEEKQEVVRDVNVRFPFFKERKSTFCAIIGIVIILLLATGFTPSGDFWMAVQDQWIALIADVFRIALVAICCVLIYFGLIKNKR